jgi:hypothetical protein
MTDAFYKRPIFIIFFLPLLGVLSVIFLWKITSPLKVYDDQTLRDDAAPVIEEAIAKKDFHICNQLKREVWMQKCDSPDDCVRLLMGDVKH